MKADSAWRSKASQGFIHLGVGLVVSAGLAGLCGAWALLWGGLAGLAALAAGTALRRGARGRLLETIKPTKPELPPLVRNLFERLPDPMLLVDLGGKALFANRAMREIVGTTVEHKHVSALLRMPSVLEALAHTARTGEPVLVEFSIRVPVERYFQAHAAIVGLDPSAIVLLLHDLTALKRAEQTRVDFVANASHELRTPLAAVTGFIETLKGPARDDVEARDTFLDIMLVEATRMRRLIEDLLSLSRIEMNEHVTPQGGVAAERLVRDAVAALEPLARAEAMTVSVDVEPGLPEVAGERDELMQLAQNLIHNAIKYGREGGRVDISLKRAPGAGRGAETLVAIAIHDDGEGIPQDAIPRLTERFYRVDIKRSREKGGTGLGLAIVKHIVNRHGGKLQIESIVGEGSTFTVFLPVLRRPPEPEGTPDTEQSETAVIEV
ncbi:MAG: ATP-binding protein [Rhizomicrobium sp.]